MIFILLILGIIGLNLSKIDYIGERIGKPIYLPYKTETKAGYVKHN